MLQNYAQKLLLPFDRLFNWLFGHKYNPLYRSGTIAVLLIFLATISGIYLVVFYRLADPYESVKEISAQAYLSGWIRSLHRYVSDGAVFAVLVHILRMLAMGRSHGPRTFAWVTGSFLLLLLFVSGLTGFILIWDVAGAAIASAGATIFDSIGLFSDPLSRSFSGATPVPPPSFFFLNLFLHIVIPLMLIFGIWIHTKKLARTVWFPRRDLSVAITVISIVVAIVWPAPLGPKADLLAIPGEAPFSVFYTAWLPIIRQAPIGFLVGATALFALLIFIPLIARPRKAQQIRPSYNDQRRCHGCLQCVSDCPYEAISMVPRILGKGSAEVAMVNPQLCVSCGLCVASCGPLAIGPPGRRGVDQLSLVKQFIAQHASDRSAAKSLSLLIGCQNQPTVLSTLKDFVAGESQWRMMDFSCAGTIHAASLDLLTTAFDQVVITACPERNCSTRDGYLLLSERVSGERHPTLTMPHARDRLQIHEVGDGDEGEFVTRLASGHITATQKKGRRGKVIATLSAALLTVGIAALSRVPLGKESESATLRLSWRLSGQTAKTCSTKAASDFVGTAKHMVPPVVCEYRPVPYQLVVLVNNERRIQETFHPGGFRHDRPIFVDRNLTLEPGEHRVEISFEPIPQDQPDVVRLNFDSLVKAARSQVVLVHLSPDQKELIKVEGTK